MFLKNETFYQIKELKDLGLISLQSTVKAGSLSPYFSKEGLDNLKIFLKENNLDKKKLVWANQTHTNIIYDLKDGILDNFDNLDGFVTDNKDIVIATFYADCLPIFAYDKNLEVMGLSHSGWPGSLKAIGINMIETMIDSYGSKKEDIIVAFGIGISGDVYEVSENFLIPFREKYKNEIINKVFRENNGKFYFDNQLFNTLIFKDYGIKEIITNKECTYSNKEFYSHRRQGKFGGRSVAIFTFKKNK